MSAGHSCPGGPNVGTGLPVWCTISITFKRNGGYGEYLPITCDGGRKRPLGRQFFEPEPSS